jgi:hypothetical protein
MMKFIISYSLLGFVFLCPSCQPSEHHADPKQDSVFSKGSFGYDLQFLQKQDSGLVVLKSGDAQVIVSPKYQAKVFTSTALGESGYSFGWINYKAFGNVLDPHMNAYGGENRLWLGPEGGKYSLFFKPDSSMVISNWKTPPPIDVESWNIEIKDSQAVSMFKEMSLLNYAGTQLRLRVNRKIQILDRAEVERRIGFAPSDSIHIVGYETENILTNIGDKEWAVATGMPCIWLLDMFKPSPETIIVVPFQPTPGKKFSEMATTNYFGEIPSDRIIHNDSVLFFKADGKSRGKLGIVAAKTRNRAGSYDGENKVLTIIQYDVDRNSRYLNQEWNITKPSFSGDAVNAYNDGPLASGIQMGPFYEIESVSPAAFLKPKQSLTHRHAVFHFTGNERTLDQIATKLLGTSLDRIQNVFQKN